MFIMTLKEIQQWKYIAEETSKAVLIILEKISWKSFLIEGVL